MLVQVKTRELIDQLPKQMKYDFIASFIELPEFLVFRTAVPYTKKKPLRAETKQMQRHEDFKEIPGLTAKYPEIAAALTLTQWRIFSMIQRKEGATRYELKSAIGIANVSDNLVATHISCLRRRFKKHGLPYDIETTKVSALNPQSRCFLVKK